MSTRGSSLKRKVDYGLLLAIYGPLLTPRQREMLSLYCDEDFGIAEVALQMQVTKQCVDDTLSRAFDRLDRLEASLGLLKQQEQLFDSLAACRRSLQEALEAGQPKGGILRAMTIIDELLLQQEE